MELATLPSDILRRIHDTVDSLALYNTSRAIRHRLYTLAIYGLTRVYMCVDTCTTSTTTTDTVFTDIVRRRNNNRYWPVFARIVSDLILFTEWLRRYPGKYPRYIMLGNFIVIKYVIGKLSNTHAKNVFDIRQRCINVCVNAARYNRVDALEYIYKNSRIPHYPYLAEAIGAYANVDTITYALDHLGCGSGYMITSIVRHGRLTEYKKISTHMMINTPDDYCFTAGASGNIDMVNYIISQCPDAPVSYYHAFQGACRYGRRNIMNALQSHVNNALVIVAKNADTDHFIWFVHDNNITDFGIFRGVYYGGIPPRTRDFLAIRGYAPHLDQLQRLNNNKSLI